jgi:Tol biopolymer transport system component
MKVWLPLIIIIVAVSSFAQDRVVFERRLDANNWEIYLINSDARFERNLTDHPAKDIEPRISPDGQRIAFASNRDGPGYEIFVMELAGSRRVRQLTNDFYVDHVPAWSPNGQKIAFGRCNPELTLCDMFVMNADGTGPLTSLANSPQDDDHPRFSPDGTQVVFSSNRDGNYEIYKCDSNGMNAQRLTNNTVGDGWANWLPDGRIIFSSLRDGTNYRLYVMNADGSNVVRLTHQTTQHDYQADVSSDGRRIVWSRNFGATYEIVEGSFNDTNILATRITLNPVHDLNADYHFVTRKAGRYR